MVFQHPERGFAGRILEPDRFVIGLRHEGLAAGRECHSTDATRMAFQHPGDAMLIGPQRRTVVS